MSVTRVLWVPPANIRRTVLDGDFHFHFRPPTASRWLADPDADWERSNAAVADPAWDHALVLAWDGNRVHAGMDHAKRFLAKHDADTDDDARWDSEPGRDREVWALNLAGGIVSYSALGGRDAWGHSVTHAHRVPGLARKPSGLPDALVPAWALATVLVVQCGGGAEFLP